MGQKTKRPTTNDKRPREKKITITFSLLPSVVDRIRELAQDDVRTVSWMAQKLVTEAIEARDKQRGSN